MSLQTVCRVFAICFLSLWLGAGFAHSEGRRVIVNEGADYFGGDYRTIKKIPLAGCKKACLDDQSCKAFTYNRKAKWCFLKKDIGELKAFKGAVAGRVVGVEKTVIP